MGELKKNKTQPLVLIYKQLYSVFYILVALQLKKSPSMWIKGNVDGTRNNNFTQMGFPAACVCGLANVVQERLVAQSLSLQNVFAMQASAHFCIQHFARWMRAEAHFSMIIFFAFLHLNKHSETAKRIPGRRRGRAACRGQQPNSQSQRREAECELAHLIKRPSEVGWCAGHLPQMLVNPFDPWPHVRREALGVSVDVAGFQQRCKENTSGHPFVKRVAKSAK